MKLDNLTLPLHKKKESLISMISLFTLFILKLRKICLICISKPVLEKCPFASASLPYLVEGGKKKHVSDQEINTTSKNQIFLSEWSKSSNQGNSSYVSYKG